MLPPQKTKNTRLSYPYPGLHEPYLIADRFRSYENGLVVRLTSKLYQQWLVGIYPVATLIIQAKKR